MKKILAVLILSLALFSFGCSRPEQAKRVLKGQGFTSIHITGYRFFGCSRGDDFSTGFEAISPSGGDVSGVVCSGFLKGATVRFD